MAEKLKHLYMLNDLYKSEINFYIISNWDAGFEVGVGNNFSHTMSAKRKKFGLTYVEAIEWLRVNAIELYPKSDFATMYAHS